MRARDYAPIELSSGLGDIAASDSASASFTINFNRCSSSARFTLRMPWTSATYERGTVVLQQQTESNEMKTRKPGTPVLVSPLFGETGRGSRRSQVTHPCDSYLLWR